MAKNSQKSLTGRIILFLICLFLGWLGIDKLYMGGSWKIALVKFLFCCPLVFSFLGNLWFLGLIGLVGAIWNIFDMICALLGKYKLNPIK